MNGKAVLAVLALGVLLLSANPAEAKYGGARSVSSTRVTSSYSRPSYSYSRPRSVVPSYTPRPRTTVVNNTTVVNQTRGPGFLSNVFSSMTGTFAGMALFNWLKPDPAPAPVAAPAAAAPVPAASAASAPKVN